MTKKVELESRFELKGKWKVRRWEAGILPALMGIGMSLHDAMSFAERTGKLVSEQSGENLITTPGKQSTAQLLIDPSLLVGLTYFALGTDNTLPDVTDTTLASESSRKTWSLTPSIVGTTSQYTVFFLASESSFAIEEAGVFGFSGATSTPDTGTMFSRYLVSEDNSGGEFDLTFDYNLEVL